MYLPDIMTIAFGSPMWGAKTINGRLYPPVSQRYAPGISRILRIGSPSQATGCVYYGRLLTLRATAKTPANTPISVEDILMSARALLDENPSKAQKATARIKLAT